MSVKVAIPARYGSSRLPGKPLLTLLEKPVVWHVIERCKEAGIDPIKDYTRIKTTWFNTSEKPMADPFTMG